VGPDGTLYATDHGPKTDDEVNVLRKGGNYGWPHVAGLRDDQAYEYARWAEATTPCSTLRFTDREIHPSVLREPESAPAGRRRRADEPLLPVGEPVPRHRPACRRQDHLRRDGQRRAGEGARRRCDDGARAHFRAQWSGRTVADLYARSRDTMPPAAPASLPAEAYGAILAYVLEVNGIAAGDVELPVDQERLSRMRIS
jgi:hypothetical protein